MDSLFGLVSHDTSLTIAIIILILTIIYQILFGSYVVAINLVIVLVLIYESSSLMKTANKIAYTAGLSIPALGVAATVPGARVGPTQ